MEASIELISQEELLNPLLSDQFRVKHLETLNKLQMLEAKITKLDYQIKKKKEILDDLMSAETKIRNSIKGEHKLERNKIARQLRMVKNKLRERVSELAKLNGLWRSVSSQMTLSRHERKIYPDPPAPAIVPKQGGCEGIKEYQSGIYFIWRKGVVVYVGQSINLKTRLSNSHSRIQPGDLFSYLIFDQPELLFAECFYIFLCRPIENCNTPNFWRGKW